MKIFNKISYLTIIILLASCASSGDKGHKQKSNESCSGNKEESGEIRIIHKSFLERINPINAFASILGGIMYDVNNMRNELNKNDSVEGNKTQDSNNNCNTQNVN